MQAQQPKKVLRIGYLSAVDPSTASTNTDGIRRALRDLGYVEGQNITIEYRYAAGNRDQFAEVAAELVRLKVDIMLVGGDRLILAAKNATRTIPIVMTGAGADPVKAGLVESLARPGGNVTGVTTLVESSAASGWSCSKKPFRNLLASQFCTSEAIQTMRSRSKRLSHSWPVR